MFGSKGGEAVGKVAASGITKMTDTADKKTDEAAKKLDEKKPATATPAVAKPTDKENTQGLRSNAMAFGQEKDVAPTGPKEQPSMIPGMIAAQRHPLKQD